MKNAVFLLGVLLFGPLSVAAAASTSTSTPALFAGKYKPTVPAIHFVDGNDVDVDGYYTNFKITITKTGRVTGKALFYSSNGTVVTPVKIRSRLAKFKTEKGDPTAEMAGVANDGLFFFGDVSREKSGKKDIFFVFVKGDFHSYALFVTKH